MERIFFTAVTLVTLAFADASTLYAAGNFPEDSKVIEISTETVSLMMPFAGGIDPIITGPTSSIKPMGIMPLLDACDADCQADRLGLRFD